MDLAGCTMRYAIQLPRPVLMKPLRFVEEYRQGNKPRNLRGERAEREERRRPVTIEPRPIRAVAPSGRGCNIKGLSEQVRS